MSGLVICSIKKPKKKKAQRNNYNRLCS